MSKDKRFDAVAQLAQNILDCIGPFGEYYESYQRQLDELCPELKPTEYLRFYEAPPMFSEEYDDG